jgi:hypothetical protein
MDIRGFGDANVRKFYDLGLLADVPGIYELDYKKISELEGFGEKSITNLQTAIAILKINHCTGLFMPGNSFCRGNNGKDTGSFGKSFARFSKLFIGRPAKS